MNVFGKALVVCSLVALPITSRWANAAGTSLLDSMRIGADAVLYLDSDQAKRGMSQKLFKQIESERQVFVKATASDAASMAGLDLSGGDFKLLVNFDLVSAFPIRFIADGVVQMKRPQVLADFINELGKESETPIFMEIEPENANAKFRMRYNLNSFVKAGKRKPLSAKSVSTINSLSGNDPCGFLTMRSSRFAALINGSEEQDQLMQQLFALAETISLVYRAEKQETRIRLRAVFREERHAQMYHQVFGSFVPMLSEGLLKGMIRGFETSRNGLILDFTFTVDTAAAWKLISSVSPTGVDF